MTAQIAFKLSLLVAALFAAAWALDKVTTGVHATLAPIMQVLS